MGELSVGKLSVSELSMGEFATPPKIYTSMFRNTRFNVAGSVPTNVISLHCGQID